MVRRWFRGGEGEARAQSSLAGVVGAGVAGVILAAGLAVAALSLSKRIAPEPKHHMEPLTSQQEAHLSSDELKDTVDQVGSEDGTAMLDDERSLNDLENSTDGLPVTSGSIDMPISLNSEPDFSTVSDYDLATSPGSSTLKDHEAKLAARAVESTTRLKDHLTSVNLDNNHVFDADSTIINTDQEGISISSGTKLPADLSHDSRDQIPDKPLVMDESVSGELGSIPDYHVESQYATERGVSSSLEEHKLNENGSSGLTNSFVDKLDTSSVIDMSSSNVESLIPENPFSSAGIPAPSLISAAMQVHPGKILVPAAIDQVQGQALAALQVLKVMEADAQPGDLCTRREYARWLVTASGTLSKNSISKVYPAMYIENFTELAFDDITPEDPDFSSIQGLAEAGLIASKLSRNDSIQSSEGGQEPFYFFPESPLSRQDLVSWKMATEKRQLPEVDRKILYQTCGFIDIDRINPDAWPAIVADHSSGEHGIMALAFGYTRLYQPDKPVTKAQAAIALSTGEAADVVNEELARIEAESIAEAAVAAHTALIAEVEKEINASFEKELALEREKINDVEKIAQEATKELERLRSEREEENNSLLRERAAIESEMGVLSRLRHDVEEQLQSLMSDKTQISFERERINKLRSEAEKENQTIAQLQYELEVERKALAMARTWAEDEAKRARAQAKALEEARERWERHGIKVVVDSDLQEDASAGVMWLNAGKQSDVDGTVGRAEILVSKLKNMASEVRGTSRAVIERIIGKVTSLISNLKERAAVAARQAGEFQSVAFSRAGESLEQLQQRAIGLSSTIKDGAKRIADDCKEGVGKISQKFKV
ncbi:hypothetical protein Syun_013146 [Stephania yunnanensis]|uniref:Uncharacterized protein n=1 Tax=Stephania yunnanensis TaxID=152371 RepID=A0AAP0K0U3_9MAGN